MPKKYRVTTTLCSGSVPWSPMLPTVVVNVMLSPAATVAGAMMSSWTRSMQLLQIAFEIDERQVRRLRQHPLDFFVLPEPELEHE